MGDELARHKTATRRAVDEVAIRRAALDYAEGWYEGDAARMERCLHSNLAKRHLKVDGDSGGTVLEHFTKEDMVRFTREGGGSNTPRELLRYEIEVIEVLQEVALVRCETALFVDFLQLVHDDGEWLIVNVLYTILEQAD
jgi:hypothetical protein